MSLVCKAVHIHKYKKNCLKRSEKYDKSYKEKHASHMLLVVKSQELQSPKKMGELCHTKRSIVVLQK